MIKLNCGLSVWEETKDIFLSNYLFFMNRALMNTAEEKIQGQRIDKIMAKTGDVVRKLKLGIF